MPATDPHTRPAARNSRRRLLAVAAVATASGALAPGHAQLRPVPGLAPPPATPAEPAARPPSMPPPAPTQRSAAPLPGEDKFYDATNPDFAALQKPNESLRGFPIDRQGYVDWMKALNDSLIRPHADLAGTVQVAPLDLDVVMKNTKEMPQVVFPHRSHTLWLDCSNCHPAIFEPRAGANPISMAEIFRGRYCGVCHDRVAFITFFSCDRCHSGPRAATPGK
jgi:c(7)-type cytochrome triheme protein